MADREKKQGDGEENLKIKDKSPLSPTAWIMFLSAEIYNVKYPDLMKDITPIMLFLIAYIGYMIASVNTVLAPRLYSLYPPLLALFAVICVIIVIYWVIDFYKVRKGEKALKELRRKIIFGEKDCIKIREEWYGILYPKKRIKYAEKN